MGYACPVCETPQSDAEHLANHLAFTAMLGDDDHEAWLDEHAPNWDEAGAAELAARVEEYAKEVGFPQVFDDTTHDHSHARRDDEPRPGDLFEDELERANAHGRGSMASGLGDTAGARGGAGGGEALEPEAQEVLREAREMTREMRERREDADEDDDDGTEGETE
ncbi:MULTISPECIES: DUF5810 domain-containing protein [Halorussus]|uniref:DUF5810 domain-containing protein n=1 Tax=Halorussus TaxID=1070314 RepID=UPI00209E01FC|nr:DUF5810 domain-containing protein [Halorussus vallis]USZ74653.1 DUF5810 domain-containing protein [Halorussus vallis]